MNGPVLMCQRSFRWNISEVRVKLIFFRNLHISNRNLFRTSQSSKMVHGDTKCFSQGSKEPEINKNGLTLFSMRFCPYAERARLVLTAKEIPYDIINIDLKSKPDWFLKRNPLGKVPTIEEPGNKIVYESLIVCEYLDATVKGKVQILPVDEFERAEQRMLIEVINEKFVNKFVSAQFKGGEEALQALMKGLGDVEKLLTDNFFAGSEVGYADLMVWPWFLRLPNLKDIRGLDIPKEKFPKIFAWVERMHEVPCVKATKYPVEMMSQFAQGYLAGSPPYDLGL